VFVYETVFTKSQYFTLHQILALKKAINTSYTYKTRFEASLIKLP